MIEQIGLMQNLDQYAEKLGIENRKVFVSLVNDLVSLTSEEFVSGFLFQAIIRKQYWLNILCGYSSVLSALYDIKERNRAFIVGTIDDKYNVGQLNVILFDLASAIVQILYKPGYNYHTLLAEYNVQISTLDKHLVETIKQLLVKLGTGLILKGQLQYQILRYLMADYVRHILGFDTFDRLLLERKSTDRYCEAEILTMDSFALITDISPTTIINKSFSYEYVFYIATL